MAPSASASDQIFEYTSGGYSLIAQVPRTATLADGTVFTFGLQEPNVSGDGAVLAYDGTATCSVGPSCGGAFTTRGYIVGEQLASDMTEYGSLRVSHNGRFSLRFGGTAAGILPGPAGLYDSQAQQLSLVNFPIAALSRWQDRYRERGRPGLAGQAALRQLNGLPCEVRDPLLYTLPRWRETRGTA